MALSYYKLGYIWVCSDYIAHIFHCMMTTDYISTCKHMKITRGTWGLQTDGHISSLRLQTLHLKHGRNDVISPFGFLNASSINSISCAIPQIESGKSRQKTNLTSLQLYFHWCIPIRSRVRLFGKWFLQLQLQLFVWFILSFSAGWAKPHPVAWGSLICLSNHFWSDKKLQTLFAVSSIDLQGTPPSLHENCHQYLFFFFSAITNINYHTNNKQSKDND